MPALYQLDDYDLCLDNQAGTYCLVYVEILPNASSALWHQIDQVSQDSKHRFRHDRVFRGVCLESCKQRINHLSEFREYEKEEILDKELISYYDKVHRRDAMNSDRDLFNKEVVKGCLNQKFSEKFSLRTRSLIEYCVSASDKDLKMGK